MCGRYVLAWDWADLAALFALDGVVPGWEARYNIAPQQDVIAVTQAPDGTRLASPFRWGLVPAWANDPTVGVRMINARVETAATKPAYRDAYRHRRCVLPANGFYEWQRTGSERQPHFIRYRESRPLLMAGLWETWSGSDTPLHTCTVLTTQANGTLAPIHDRMPVLLEPAHLSRWLDPSQDVVTDLIQPTADDLLERYPVSTKVNRVGHEGPACIDPIEWIGGLFDGAG